MTACGMPFEQLNAYVDGELEPAAELDVRRHLDLCATCGASIETLTAVKQAVAAGAEVRPVPHTLRERIGTLGRSRAPRWRHRLRHLATLAAVVLVVVGLGRLALRRHTGGGSDRVTQALVADHLHFLHEPDPLEVASDDPETVGAWFGDKLPFPVRLPRLRTATLLGGRLCSLWGHKVALAFYEARGRRLSVFVADPAALPTTPSVAGGCTTPLRDYWVCLIPGTPTMLVMVADREQTEMVLPELRADARRR